MDAAGYVYRAVRRDGVQVVGVVEAESRDAALEVLAERGLFPFEVRRDEASGPRRTRLSHADLALGLRMLSTLLESGLPLPRALSAMAELAPAAWKAAIEPIRESVRRGESLAGAFRSSALEVPPVVVGIIQAGEAGGRVAEAVRRAADLTEAAATTRAAIRGALVYPAVLAFAGTASVGLLVGVVLPRFAAILADLGQALPTSTRIVLTLANTVRAGAIPALLAACVLGFAWRAWTSSRSGRTQWHGLLLSIPTIGRVRRAAATSRACAAASALLETGTPIAACLSHAAETTGDAAVSARLAAAREAVIAGQGLARSLDRASALTPTAVRLIRTGEQTGRLAAMLAHAARLESQRAEHMVRSAVRLLEPALILAFAGLVALVAAALLQAVYSVRPVP